MWRHLNLTSLIFYMSQHKTFLFILIINTILLGSIFQNRVRGKESLIIHQHEKVQLSLFNHRNISESKPDEEKKILKKHENNIKPLNLSRLRPIQSTAGVDSSILKSFKMYR